MQPHTNTAARPALNMQAWHALARLYWMLEEPPSRVAAAADTPEERPLVAGRLWGVFLAETGLT